jgi:hypothetical protein
MAEVVNLNKYRKKHNRALGDRRAAANRIRFGRTKPEKARERQENERERTDTDGKKLD